MIHDARFRIHDNHESGIMNRQYPEGSFQKGQRVNIPNVKEVICPKRERKY